MKYEYTGTTNKKLVVTLADADFADTVVNAVLLDSSDKFLSVQQLTPVDLPPNSKKYTITGNIGTGTGANYQKAVIIITNVKSDGNNTYKDDYEIKAELLTP